MQRSKQQALMFLLGALLVGGVLGFSADRVLGCAQGPAGRERMYDDLGLTAAQRTQMDTAIDARHRQIEALLTPLKPQFDSIRTSAHEQFRRIMTPGQWAKFEQRETQDSARRAQAHMERGR